MYKNNSYDMVKPFFMDKLITSGKVKRFLRAEGWVVIGHDPIRIRSEIFAGPDRRLNSSEIS